MPGNPAGFLTELRQALLDHGGNKTLDMRGKARVTSFADNLLKPLLIGCTARISSTLILLGHLAGLSMLGILGVFVGPILMGMGQSKLETLLKTASSNGDHPGNG
ncbi:MAG: AI-2E family transporter [Acidithiobacillus sp.]